MKFDAIVVLSGGLTDDKELPSGVLLRIRVAKKLFAQRLAPRVIMSGRWSSYWDPDPPDQSESRLMAQQAVSWGISSSAILEEEYSQNTYENAFYVKKTILEPNDWTDIIVVTSDYHALRTKQIFEQILGEKYLVSCVSSPVQDRWTVRMRRSIKELIFSLTSWFPQHRFYRRKNF